MLEFIQFFITTGYNILWSNINEFLILIQKIEILKFRKFFGNLRI